ncbi:RidA family protein [Marinovum sp. 2_MG-2023]|uniref:RidA family protein n=1 Tax=unclassified Marinovum TaxID=2647166 RepID=UPI0026E3960A|nr:MULTISPECIES: RidA family protein [unclassified Marinovum]MDO6732590.1 RidA family protein [Marinovum sp. 2_MG-2023]MDO6782043.1 RidA family protein [Marinovum sp. 1_MG-2023]
MAKVHLAPYVRNGDTVITSGQLGFDENGVISGDITEQTNRILKRIETLLSEQGMTLLDVGKTSVWLVNADDFAAFNDAYAAAFGDHMPARSTVVSALTAPGALIEIEAMAWTSR